MYDIYAQVRSMEFLIDCSLWVYFNRWHEQLV